MIFNNDCIVIPYKITIEDRERERDPAKPIEYTQYTHTTTPQQQRREREKRHHVELGNVKRGVDSKDIKLMVN